MTESRQRCLRSANAIRKAKADKRLPPEVLKQRAQQRAEAALKRGKPEQ